MTTPAPIPHPYRLFFAKLALFLVPVGLGLAAFAYYQSSNQRYQKAVHGREIYWAINKSGVRQKVHQLLLGDSVAQQLYDNRRFNGAPHSLACNQSISCVGYYILLSEFLETNADQLPDQVVLLVHPSSMDNNLDQKFTYQYFLKPFNSPRYWKYFSPAVWQQIRKLPYYYLSQFPLVKIGNWSPPLPLSPTSTPKLMTPIKMEYLPKIQALCTARGIRFHLVPAPVSKAWLATIQHQRLEALQIADSMGLRAEYEAFLDGIISIGDEHFYPDGIHFLKPDEIRDQYVAEKLRRLAQEDR